MFIALQLFCCCCCISVLFRISHAIDEKTMLPFDYALIEPNFTQNCFKCKNDILAPEDVEKENGAAPSLHQGSMILGCGKTYFLGATKADSKTANSKCCDSYMSLISLETSLENTCLRNKLKGSEFYDRPVWTSGIIDPEGEIGWCTVGMLLNSEARGLLDLGGGAKARCIAFHPQKGKLIRVDCNSQLNYLCETSPIITAFRPLVATKIQIVPLSSKMCDKYECVAGTCTEYEIRRNLRLRKTAPGFQAPVQRICGKQYYLGYSLLDQRTASDYCCQDRMVLAAIESEQEFECIKKLYKNEKKPGNKFWVGAARSRSSRTSWGWCAGSGGSCREIDSPRIKPGLQEHHCLVLEFPETNKTNVKDLEPVLRPAPCSVTWRFICEEPPAFIDNSVQFSAKPTAKAQIEGPSDKGCDKAACPTINCTDVSRKEMKNYRRIPNQLVAPIQSLCGKKYFIGYNSHTHQSAAQSCCEDDMALANINNEKEMDCIRQLYKNEKKSGKQFWIGGAKGASSGWGWCPQVSRASCVDIEEGLVSSGASGPSCLSVDFGSANREGAFKSRQCGSQLRFICESLAPSDREKPEKSRPTSTKKMIQVDPEGGDDDEPPPPPTTAPTPNTSTTTLSTTVTTPAPRTTKGEDDDEEDDLPTSRVDTTAASAGDKTTAPPKSSKTHGPKSDKESPGRKDKAKHPEGGKEDDEDNTNNKNNKEDDEEDDDEE